MVRYNVKMSYSKLSPELKEAARNIYEEKERNPRKSFDSIIEDHPEFTFKSKERARQLRLAHKNHLTSQNKYNKI